jgi:hypothetical protein
VQISQFSNGLEEQFIQWMREEHMQDMLGIDGCLECRVLRWEDGSVSCEYLFSTQDRLDAYLKEGAKTMREKGLKKFAGSSLSYQRSTQPMVLEKRRLAQNDTP